MRLLELQFYSWRQEEIVRGQIRWTTAILSAARNCCTNSAVLVPPSFQTFLADLLSHTLQNGTALVIVHCFANFLHIFICVTWGGMTSCSHPSKEVSAHLNQKKKNSKVHVLCMRMSLKTVLDISCVPDSHFPSMKQILIQMHCSFK